MRWIDILILCAIGAALFFAARAVYRAKKRGGCVGCSGCSGCSDCAGCSHRGCSVPKDHPPEE